MGPRIGEESEISSISLPWLRHRLQDAFNVTRNPSSRTLGTLLAASAILATQLPRVWLAGGKFSDCSAPSCQLYAPLAPLRPPHCSASFRLFGDLSGYPTFSWSPARAWMLKASLLGALPPIWRTHGLIKKSRPTDGSSIVLRSETPGCPPSPCRPGHQPTDPGHVTVCDRLE